MGIINANLQQIADGGDTELEFVHALDQWTQAVISEPKLQETEKQDVLEAVATITKEAAKKPEERSKGTLKLLVAGLPTAITAANNLMILWDKLGPTIKAHFGI